MNKQLVKDQMFSKNQVTGIFDISREIYYDNCDNKPVVCCGCDQRYTGKNVFFHSDDVVALAISAKQV